MKNQSPFHLVLLTLVLLGLSSCWSTKNADTRKPKKRSIAFLTDQLEEKRCEPEWFSTKMKLKSEENYFGVKTIQLNVRGKRDSLIWMSAIVQMGIKLEVGRVLISPDSIKVMDKFNKRYYAEPFDYIQNYLDYPFTFTSFQDLLLGNVPDRASYTDANNLVGRYVLQAPEEEVWLNPVDYTVIGYTKAVPDSDKLLSVENLRFDEINGHIFPVERKMSLHVPESYIFDCQFSNTEFDEKQKFPFKVSSQYQRVR